MRLKKNVSHGDGVIRDPEIHRQVLLDVLGFTHNKGFNIHGLIKSPFVGAERECRVSRKAESGPSRGRKREDCPDGRAGVGKVIMRLICQMIISI